MISITLRSLEILLQAWHSGDPDAQGRHREVLQMPPTPGWICPSDRRPCVARAASRGARQNAAPRLLEPNGHHIAVINTVAFLAPGGRRPARADGNLAELSGGWDDQVG